MPLDVLNHVIHAAAVLAAAFLVPALPVLLPVIVRDLLTYDDRNLQ